MIKRLFVFLFIVNSSFVFSQELICNVNVTSNKIQSSDKQKFNTLQSAIREFMNNRKWTNEIFKDDERIECNISINILEELSTDQYKASINIQSSRPIFNSSYYSPLLTYIDEDFNFKYTEFQTLEFNENSSISNLTSVLAYYAYIIIGLDFYTFSLEGGASYLQKAKDIVNNSQNNGEPGWKAFENNKNRYWLAEELLDAKYSDYRTCLYNYHRNGLDKMYDDSEKARASITESLEYLRKVKRQNPTAFILRIFFDAKSSEIANIYSDSFQDEKARVVNLLTELDPSNISKYNKIKESKNLNQPDSKF
jgi:hypothetical protein